MSPERRARPAECVDNGSHGVVVAIGLRGFQHEQHALGEVAGNNGLSLQVVATALTVGDANEKDTMDFDWLFSLRVGVDEHEYSSGRSAAESTCLCAASFKSIWCTV